MPSRTAEIVQMEIPLQLAALGRTLTVMREAIAAVEADLTSGVESPLATFDAAFAAAERDPKLSAQGRQDSAQDAGRAVIASLDAFIGTKVTPLESRAANAETSLRALPAPPTDVAARIIAELRAAEIRRPFVGLDPIEREAVYLGTDNLEVRQALEEGPWTISRVRPGELPVAGPLVDPARVRELVLARAETRNPELAAELKDLERLIRVYRTVVASARAAVLEVVPGVREVAPIAVR